MANPMSTAPSTTDAPPAGAAAADHSLDHLGDDLRQELRSQGLLEKVLLCAPHDLDSGGRYAAGCLLLTADAFGHCLRTDGRWAITFTPIASLSGAVVVEGLGMSLLRLLEGGRTRAEFRYSLRHARQVARLQRRLERMIDGKAGDDVPEAPRKDEKKIRCEKCERVIPPWAEVCPACTSKRKILFRLLDFVKPYRARAVAGAVLALVLTGLGLLQPVLSRPMLNQGLGAAPGATPNWNTFVTLLMLLTGLILLRTLGGGLQAWLMAGLGSRVARDVRDATYRHLHRLSLSFFGKKPTGSLVTRVTSDSDRLWDFVAFTVVESTTAILTIVGVAAVMFSMHWKLALFTLLPVPVMIVLMIFFHGRLHDFFGRIWHRWSQMTSVVADALPGVRVIKAFSQEKREVNRFQGKNHQVFDEEMKMVHTWTTFGPVMQFCTQLGNLIVWLLGGWWTIQNFLHVKEFGTPMPGGVDVGTLVAFMGLMEMFYRPIHMIAHMDRNFNRAATSAQRIFEVLDTEPTIFSKSGATVAQRVRGEIELRNVSFSYDGVRKVLRNVSVKIAPGEMIGLAGPSGGGKTTMVNLICRFYDVLEGQILIDGVDVRDYEVESLRQKIGVVLQEPFLFHGTVAENIAYGRPETTLGEIITAARAANAHDFIVGFPDGYDTMVGERGQSLSGGERQRISIARAILNNPTILILDEATSSVDTETEKLIQEALDRLIADRTTIAIAHRLSTLRKADRLVVLEQGEIKELGSHEELAGKEDGIYAKLLRMQNELQATIAIG
jgi:ATP-binding cassette subfamily B protein